MTTPRTESGRDLIRAIFDDEGGMPVDPGMAVRAVELEASALTLDACREHMGCACSGIEGHLATRGLLPSKKVVG